MSTPGRSVSQVSGVRKRPSVGSHGKKEVLLTDCGLDVLIDVVLAFRRRRSIGGERLAKGVIVGAAGARAHPQHEAVGSEVVLHQVVCQMAFALNVGMEMGGQQTSLVDVVEQCHRIATDKKSASW